MTERGDRTALRVADAPCEMMQRNMHADVRSAGALGF